MCVQWKKGWEVGEEDKDGRGRGKCDVVGGGASWGDYISLDNNM